VIRTSVWVSIHAPPGRVVATFLDYARWPRIFPRTIGGTELARPYALLAPLLRGVVARALRRYTLEPMRTAAERWPPALGAQVPVLLRGSWHVVG